MKKVRTGESEGVILYRVSRKSSQRRGKLGKDLKKMREIAPQKFKGRVPGAKAPQGRQLPGEF